jgi:hypothetical protein
VKLLCHRTCTDLLKRFRATGKMDTHELHATRPTSASEQRPYGRLKELVSSAQSVHWLGATGQVLGHLAPSVHISPQRRAMGLTAGVRFPAGKEIFLFLTALRHVLGSTQLPIQWFRGGGSPGVKRQVREAGHSPPFRAEVKNGGAIPLFLICLRRV